MTARPDPASSSTRDRILDAAQDLICTGGIGGFTLDAVARLAGTSKGGLLYHFSSKDSLISGLHRRLAEHLEGRLRDAERQGVPVLLAFIRELRQDYEAGGRRFAPLLLAHEQQDPFRELQALMTGLLRRSTVPDNQDGALLLLASLGVVLASLTRIPHLEPEQATRLFDRMEAAAEAVPARPLASSKTPRSSRH
jgi:AcrR family transcriptional regulator